MIALEYVSLVLKIPLAAVAGIRGSDWLLLWVFVLLFSVEGVLIIVGIFPVPAVWSLGSEGSYPTYLHSAVLLFIALVAWFIFAQGYRSSGGAAAAKSGLPVVLLGPRLSLPIDGRSLRATRKGVLVGFRSLGYPGRHFRNTQRSGKSGQ